MTEERGLQLRHLDRFFIGGEWVAPSSEATIAVTDSASEQEFFSVAEAQAADVGRAVEAARQAFDAGPWPRLTHAERAEYLRAIATALRKRGGEVGDIWPRESGVLHGIAKGAAEGAARKFEYYASLADTFPFEEEARPTAGGEFGLLVREPVGVVGAIIPWNVPMTLISNKLAPALLAGCTEVLKSSPEAPGEGYVLAEIAEEVGLPPGVLNVVTADREVSELLVRDPRVDKITFTGSTAAGRRIAAICGERIARCTLELGGKSAAVILDDIDLETVARTIAGAECFLSGQVCSSLTRIVVSRHRHDELSMRSHPRSRRCVSAIRLTQRHRWDRSRPSASEIGSSDTSTRARRKVRPSRPGAGVRLTSNAGGSSSQPCSGTSTTAPPSHARKSSGRS